MATKETVKRCLAVLAGSKPGTDMATVNLESYALALEPVPDAVLEQVTVAQTRVKGAFIPDSGTMFEECLDLLDPEPPVAKAWALVEKHARGNHVELPPRAAAALAAMGGDPERWDPADLNFRRREFLAEYERQRNRWRANAQAGRLALPKPKMKVRMIE
jgi:hypothetical protein